MGITRKCICKLTFKRTQEGRQKGMEEISPKTAKNGTEEIKLS